MADHLRPLHDRVVVERDEQDQVSKGGIIIPDTAKEKPARGVVLAVGSGKYDERGQRVPLTVQVGDRVLFGKWCGTELEVDGKKVVVCREEEILAVIAGGGQ